MSNYDGLSVSRYVIASMCGCWKRESNVNPGIWESLIVCDWDYEYEYTNRGGFGLGQWTNIGTKYGRLYNLHTYVTSAGYEDGDGYGQLDFVVAENYWTPKSAVHLGYQTLTQFLTSESTSLDDLVWDFLACWEGVTGDHYNERLEYANIFLNYINEHENDETEWTWISTNNYLSDTQMCNNVMVIYKYITGSSPPPPPPPPPPTEMPLWLWLLFKRKRRPKIVNY